MNTDDTELALRCLALAADIRRLEELDPRTRERVLNELCRLLELLFEVFLYPEPGVAKTAP